MGLVQKRLKPGQRRLQILETAYRITQQPGGWDGLTREAVASACGVSPGLINQYYATLPDLITAIYELARERQDFKILAHAAIHQHPITKEYTDYERFKIAREFADSLGATHRTPNSAEKSQRRISGN